ncbi:MAG: alkaline phosphatase family protein, partial [Sphingomonadales bacterium]|nr:alkaline phosphatase family protein [Sphingomonadales bacterium]
PAAIDAANRRIGGIVGRPRQPRTLPAQCAPFSRAVPIGNGQSVGTGLFASDAVTARQLLTSPDADEILLETAAGLAEELSLGRRGSIDLLAIGLAAADYIGHTYGPGGAEMCIELAAVDAALGRFFEALDARGVNYVAMLTSDHGGLDMPERQVAQGAGDAERLDGAAVSGLDAEIAEAMGLSGPILHNSGGMYYVDRSVPEDRRTEAIDRATALLRANRQVYAVYTRDQIMEQPLVEAPPENWTLLDRLRASFHPDRSGDFIIVLQPRVTPIPDPTGGYVATHGSPWDYDREVPILFWWPGADHMEQPLGVMTVDIMPTLASLIGFDISGVEIDGRCLDVMAAIDASNCP